MNINIEEALRYVGAADADEATRRAMEQTAEDVTARIIPRFVYRVFGAAQTPEGVSLPEANLLLPGKMANAMLSGCDRAILLCCTLGAAFDRMLRMAQARDMAKAAMLNACGSAYVETGCEEAEKEIAARYPNHYLTDRFSPGYGDLPLTVQPVLLNALNAEKRLGVTLTDTCLMLPAKSVTAIIGLSDTPQPARIRGCGYCSLSGTCAYRERGTHCGV
ncbi:MAG: methionine synthase [Clostridia bacterium]|nr:methionine synthase [Clostridia bacterium]